MAEISMSEASLKIPIEMPATLYQVSLEGDVLGLKRLLQEDELVLDRLSAITSFSETPLHIAAMRGHFDFARALLRYKPQLAGESDSLLRLPLHWAAEKGYTNIVRELLQKSCPDHACFSRDQDGRIALHLAALKERNDVVKELIRTRPESIREKVENGGTILHLCVKYNRLEALKLLLDTTQGRELVNERDDHGNTILHLAAIFKQVEITKYLVSKSINIDANALNTNGFTALGAIEHSPLDSKALEIKNILLEAGIQKKTDNPPSVLLHPTSSESIILKGCLSVARKCMKLWKNYINNFRGRLEEARGSILIAATVTATLAFQAGVNPPDMAKKPDQELELPNATNATSLHFGPTVRSKYGFWYYNTVSLLYSLVIILSMLSGIPFLNKFSSLLLVFCMAEVLSNLANAYILAADSNFSNKKNQRNDMPKAVFELFALDQSPRMPEVFALDQSPRMLAVFALDLLAGMLTLMYVLIIFIHVFNLALSLVFMILNFILWLIAKMLNCVCRCFQLLRRTINGKNTNTRSLHCF